MRRSGSSGPTGLRILPMLSGLSNARRRSRRKRGTTPISASAGGMPRSRCGRRRSKDCTRTISSWQRSSTASRPRELRKTANRGRKTVPTYIMLANWTDQGAQKVKDSPRRVDVARKALFDMGGEFKALYMTMGEYDLTVVYEAPDDAVATRFTLQLGMLGTVRTKTLKAFPEAAYREIIASLG